MTFPSLSLEQYSGLWFEIAKYPHIYDVQENTQPILHYTLKYDNVDSKPYYEVIVGKWHNNKVISKRRAIVWIPELSDLSKQKIEYLGSGKTLDHWIHDVDYSNYTIVGSPNKQYLWLLARSPVITDQQYQCLLDQISYFGYDPLGLKVNLGAVK